MNCRILVLGPDTKAILHQIGTIGVCAHDPPNDVGSPNGDTRRSPMVTCSYRRSMAAGSMSTRRAASSSGLLGSPLVTRRIPSR
jgi:hypothetical protein